MSSSPPPPPAKSDAAGVTISDDTTSRNSGGRIRSAAVVTSAEAATPRSRLDDDLRMEAALAMTQMSQGGGRHRLPANGRLTATSTTASEGSEQRRQHYQRRARDHSWRRERLDRRPVHCHLVGERMWPKDTVIRHSSQVNGHTEMESLGSRLHNDIGNHGNSRDWMPVDGAELARMTQAVLRRQAGGTDHASVGRFYRTSSRQDADVATDSAVRAPQIPQPYPAYRSAEVAVAAVERPTESRREIRRSLSDGIYRNHCKMLTRRTSEPSELRRSPYQRIRPSRRSPAISAVPMSNGWLGIRDRPPSSSSSFRSNLVERSGFVDGGGLISPALAAVGVDAPYWGVIPLTAMDASGFQLSVPRVAALQEAERVFPERSSQTRRSFAGSEVAVSAPAPPLPVDKCRSDFLFRDPGTTPNLILMSTAVSTTAAENQPVYLTDDGIVKAMESVKVEDQIRTDAEVDCEPLDLTSASAASHSAAAACDKEPRPVKPWVHGRVSTLGQRERSSSFGSLAALKAFYDNPSMKSKSNVTRSGSLNSPVTDSVDAISKASTGADEQHRSTVASKRHATQCSGNADVAVDGCSKFRPPKTQNAASISSSSAETDGSDPLECTSKKAAGATNLQRSSCWNHKNNNSCGASPNLVDLQIPPVDDGAGLASQMSRVSTGDATVMESAADTVSSSAEVENGCDARALMTEASRSLARVTLKLRESPSTLKTPVDDQSAEAEVEENNKDATTQNTSNCVFDSRPVFNDHLATSRSGSFLSESNSSRDHRLDFNWKRLPPKKRRMLDLPSTSSSVQQVDAEMVDTAEDPRETPDDKKSESCETNGVNPAHCGMLSI